jgi:hypothetical protein
VTTTVVVIVIHYVADSVQERPKTRRLLGRSVAVIVVRIHV